MADKGVMTVSVDPMYLKRTEGYMTKKGGVVHGRGRHNWKKRYFILKYKTSHPNDPFELYYFAKRGEKHAKGRVILDDAEVLCQRNKRATDESRFDFQILLRDGGLLELYCDTNQERDEWIQSINMVLAVHRKKRQALIRDAMGAYNPDLEDETKNYQQGEDIAQSCEAFGPGLFGGEAGQVGTFQIQANDTNGVPMRAGGLPFAARLESDDILYHLRVEDNEDGTYVGNYLTCRSGDYKLSILLNDEHHVYGSPFSLTILPGHTNLDFCVVSGPGIEKLQPQARTTIAIMANDQYGNKRSYGGDSFEVGITGPASLQSLTDNGDGSYACVLDVLDPEDLSDLIASSVQIHITLNGKHLKGSPFTPVFDQNSLGKSKIRNSMESRDEAEDDGINNDRQVDRSIKASIAVDGDNDDDTTAVQPVNDAKAVAASDQAQRQPTSSGNATANTQAQGSFRNPSAHSSEGEASGGQLMDIATISGVLTAKNRLQLARERAMRAKKQAQDFEATGEPSGRSIPADVAGGRRHEQQQQQQQDKSVAAVAVAATGTPVVSTKAKSLLASAAQRARAKYNEEYNKNSVVSPVPVATSRSPVASSEFRSSTSSYAPSGSPELESIIWNATVDATHEEAVVGIINRNMDQIKKVFQFYSSNSTTMTLGNDAFAGGIMRFVHDFDISPSYLIKKEVKRAFAIAVRMQSSASSEISMSGFVEFLTACSLLLCSQKPSYSSLYPTNTARWEQIILQAWGVSDASKLNLIASSAR